MYWMGREMSKTEAIQTILTYLWNINLPRTVENVKMVVRNHGGSLNGTTTKFIERQIAQRTTY